MKRILLPFMFFCSTAFAHNEQIMVRHPQANVNYYCQPGQSLSRCIDIACSYATLYDCRVISQVNNVYYIESYLPRNIIVVDQPVYGPPCIFSWLAFGSQTRYYRDDRVYHRPHRNIGRQYRRPNRR